MSSKDYTDSAGPYTIDFNPKAPRVVGTVKNSAPVSNSISFMKLNANAKFPLREKSGTAGFDLYALNDTLIEYGAGFVAVETGIAARGPQDSYMQIAMRSGLAIKQHLMVGAGIVDNDYYPGHIKVLVTTTKAGHSYLIKKGERFAQLLFIRLASSGDEYNIVCHGSVADDTTITGESSHAGFGSTGQF